MKLTLIGILRIALIAALLIVAVMAFTSCQKENSVQPALVSGTKDSINVKIQSVDIDGKVNYSLQTRYTN